MNRRPVLCDYCGEPIERLADAWAQWLRDLDLDVVTELTLVHHATARRGCTYHERRKAGHVQDHHASVFVDPNSPHAAYLRDLARVPEGASVTRLLAKVRRLARLAPKPAPDRPAEGA